MSDTADLPLATPAGEILYLPQGAVARARFMHKLAKRAPQDDALLTLVVDGTAYVATWADLKAANLDATKLVAKGVLDSVGILADGSKPMTGPLRLAAPVAPGDAARVRDVQAEVAPFRPLRPRYVQRHLTAIDLGMKGRTTDTQIFPNSGGAPQSIAYLNDGKKRRLFLTKVVSGGTFLANETCRIMEFEWREDGTTVLVAYSQEMKIGHGAGLGAVLDASGQVWLYTTCTTEPGFEERQAEKGFAKVKWRGGDTSQADVKNYRLWGYTGSGHPFEAFAGASIGMSPDGKYLVMGTAYQERNAPFGVAPGDDPSTAVFVYDRAAVEALADPLDARPLLMWIDNPPGDDQTNFIQGITTDGEHIYLQRGFFPAFGQHILEIWTMDGTLLRRLRTDDARALYTKDQLLGHPNYGNPGWFEAEGLAIIDGDVAGIYTEFWADGGSIVSYAGSNWACYRKPAAGISPMDAQYWVKTRRPATDGAWDASRADYSLGYNTHRLSHLYAFHPARGEAGEQPLESGRTAAINGAQRATGRGSIKDTFPYGSGWSLAAYSEQLEGYLLALNYYQNALQIYDQREGARPGEFGSVVARYQGDDKYLGIRGLGGSLAQGAGANFHARDAGGSNPGGISLYTTGPDGSNWSWHFNNAGEFLPNGSSGNYKIGSADRRLQLFTTLLDFGTPGGPDDAVRPTIAARNSGADRYLALRASGQALSNGAGINIGALQDGSNPGGITLYSISATGLNYSVRVTGDGTFRPNTNGGQDLGTVAWPWKSVAAKSTIMLPAATEPADPVVGQAAYSSAVSGSATGWGESGPGRYEWNGSRWASPRNSIPGILNYNPNFLLRWRAARNRVMAGLGDAVVGLMGNSTVAGCGAGINDLYDRARRRSAPARAAERLNALGLSTTLQNIWGDSGFTPSQTAAVLGPEVVIGAGWATASSGALGGDAWQQTTAGGMFEWTPTVPVSHFKWWNVWYGSDRVIAIFVDGAEVQRLNTKSSPVAFVGTEIACPGGLGTHTLGLKYISGNAAGFHGLEAYNKDAKSVRIHNFGHGGGKTTEILEAGITDTQVGYPLNAIKTIAPDLVVLETGLNDTATEIANGTTAAALQAGIASLKQTSDVVLQIPNPSALARRSQVTQDQLTSIILDAGLRNGCPVINLRDVFGGSYDAGLAMGLYAGGADLVHPNAAGYVGEGYMLADLLMRA